MIALKGNISFGSLGKSWHCSEFASGHALLEIRAVQDVLKVFYAVDKVFAEAVGTDDETHMVPLADRFCCIQDFSGGGIDGRLVEGVEPSTALWVSGQHVVLKLKFWTC